MSTIGHPQLCIMVCDEASGHTNMMMYGGAIGGGEKVNCKVGSFIVKSARKRYCTCRRVANNIS